MTVAEIRSKLGSCITELERVRWLLVYNPDADFTRQRRLTFRKMIRLFLQLESQRIDKELNKFFDFSENTPSESAFSQARSKIKPLAFEYLLHLFNQAVPLRTEADGKHLLAADGSNINIAYNPDDPETFIQPENSSDPAKVTRGHNRLHLNAFYHLLDCRYTDALIQPIHAMDEKKAFCTFVDRYTQTPPASTIILADRGYFSYNVVAHLQEHKFYYLIRAKEIGSPASTLATYAEIPKDPSAEFDIEVARYLTHSQKAIPRCEKNIYKFIDKATPFDYLDDDNIYDLYYIHFRVVRFKISKDTYEVVVTNLPALEYPPEKIKDLYNLRWGVETSFRELKITIGLACLHGKKREYAEQEILARLVTYNFCEAVTSQVVIDQDAAHAGTKEPENPAATPPPSGSPDTGTTLPAGIQSPGPAPKKKKYQYKVDHSMAVQFCREYLKTMDSDEPPIDVEARIKKYTVPIRPGRHFQRKMSPQGFIAFIYRIA